MGQGRGAGRRLAAAGDDWGQAGRGRVEIQTEKKMSNDELQKLAQEYNEMQEEGRAMWEDIEGYAVRMKEIREIIDEEKPGCYDEIVLLFGGKLDLDL